MVKEILGGNETTKIVFIVDFNIMLHTLTMFEWSHHIDS